MAAERRRAGAKGRSLAVAASVVAHAGFFLLLVWRLGIVPVLPETPVMNVQLATLPRDRPREAAPKPPRERAAVKPGKPAKAFIPNLVVPETSQPTGPVAPPGSGQGEGVRQALRGLVGCERADLVSLSPEERQRCRDRQTAQTQRLQAGASPKLNFDRRGEFAANPEPYLMRRPKTGCKVRAGGDIAPMGAQGVASGLACAWSF